MINIDLRLIEPPADGRSNAEIVLLRTFGRRLAVEIVVKSDTDKKIFQNFTASDSGFRWY